MKDANDEKKTKNEKKKTLFIRINFYLFAICYKQ